MEGWKYWEGKQIYIILKNQRKYSGKVLEVEEDKNSNTYFITILDKFNNRISFVSSEIKLIQEEGDL